MKHKFIFLLAALAFSFLNSCDDDDSRDDSSTDTYDFTNIINDYVDSTVIKTYASLKDKSISLFNLTETFKTSGSQTSLNEACEAWRATRVPWEQSESFLFGPASFQSLDPLLDSWPLDQAQLDQVLAGNQALTADYVRNGLGAVLRGFHTMEYLLFRDGNPRVASEVTSREKDYLVAVSQVLRDDCIKLWGLWHGSTGITGLEAEVLADLDVDAGVGYGYEFKNAGKAGSRYISQKDAVDEIIQGSMDIADEVGNGKLADPYNAQNPILVESWFSWNSLSDFKNNIRSIENSFYGGADKKGTGLVTFIEEKQPALATTLRTKIDAAIAAINGIPEPFRNNLDKGTQIQAAMDAVNDLSDFLSSDIKALLDK